MPATAIAGTALAACSRRRRPNILFVMCDDHAWGEMSCYGNRVLQTPNMDRLAAGGTRFANAFCTNSLCAPSRATALTGCYSHIHGVRGNSESKDANERMRPGIATWPKLLQQAGYRTGITGKWHLNDQPEGFDYSCVLPGQGVYFDPEFIENGRRRKIPGYVTDITTDLALQFLERAGDRPSRWPTSTRRPTALSRPRRATPACSRTGTCPTRPASTTTTPRAAWPAKPRT